jgi:hypothetical protein
MPGPVHEQRPAFQAGDKQLGERSDVTVVGKKRIDRVAGRPRLVSHSEDGLALNQRLYRDGLHRRREARRRSKPSLDLKLESQGARVAQEG